MIAEITEDLWIDLESIVFLQIDKGFYQNDLRAVVSFKNRESITLRSEATENLKNVLRGQIDLTDFCEKPDHSEGFMDMSDLDEIIPY